MKSGKKKKRQALFFKNLSTIVWKLQLYISIWNNLNLNTKPQFCDPRAPKWRPQASHPLQLVSHHHTIFSDWPFTSTHLLWPASHNHPLCCHQLGRWSSYFTISSPQCQFPLKLPMIYRPRRPRAWRNQLPSQTHLQGLLLPCFSPLPQWEAPSLPNPSHQHCHCRPSQLHARHRSIWPWFF